MNAGIEFGNGAQVHQPQDQVLRELHRRLRRRRQGQGGDARRHRPGRRHPLPHPQSRPARHGAGGAARRARTSSAATPTAAAPIRSTSPTRSPASATRSSTPSSRPWPAPGSRAQAVRPGDGPEGFRHGDLQGARPSMKAKLEEIKKDLLAKEDQGSRATQSPMQRRWTAPGHRRCSRSTLASASASAACRRSTTSSASTSAPASALPAGRERRRQVDAVQPDLRRLRSPTPATCARRRAVRRRRARPRRWRRASPWCTSISAWCRDMTVVENLMLGQVARRAEAPRVRARASRDIAESFGFALDPDARGRRAVGRRAPARRDREVPDARAASLLVLDEPTAVLLPGEIGALLDVCARVADSRPRRRAGDAQARRDRARSPTASTVLRARPRGRATRACAGADMSALVRAMIQPRTDARSDAGARRADERRRAERRARSAERPRRLVLSTASRCATPTAPCGSTTSP